MPSRYTAPKLAKIRQLDALGLQRMKSRAIEETAHIERALLTHPDKEDPAWINRATLALLHWGAVPDLCDSVIEERRLAPDLFHQLLLSLLDDVGKMLATDDAGGEGYRDAYEGVQIAHLKIHNYLNGDHDGREATQAS